MEKDLAKNIESMNDLIKKLLMLELAKNDFNRDEVRKIMGKIDNNQFSAITSVLKKKKGASDGK